jgi:hypothetical protein
LRDGTVHRRRVQALYGSPAAPLSEEALVAKFVDCGTRAMRPRGPSELHRIATDLLALERLGNVRAVLARL